METVPQKRFNEPDHYGQEIRKLVPAYGALHELALAALLARVEGPGRLGVVGCGPGAELVALAGRLPDWEIEAYEPSRAMVESARRLLAARGLTERVTVHPAPLERRSRAPWDAAYCLLVAHLLPNERARVALWSTLARSMRPDAPLLLAEIEAVDATTLNTWAAWATDQGCSEERVDLLKSRLRGGFDIWPAHRTFALAAGLGFDFDEDLLHALGVSLRAWRRTQDPPQMP